MSKRISTQSIILQMTNDQFKLQTLVNIRIKFLPHCNDFVTDQNNALPNTPNNSIYYRIQESDVTNSSYNSK